MTQIRHVLFFLIFNLISFSIFSQIIPNGMIDNLDEMHSKQTVYIKTKDGIHLSTDIYLPILQDSVVSVINIGGVDYTLQLIPKNTQYIIYDTTNITADNFSLPIIFVRSPYNKESDPIGGQIFPFLGYAYVMQDMRGRYDSEGVYFPMYSDSWAKYEYHPFQSIPMDLYPIADSSNALHHTDGSEAIYYLNDSLYRLIDHDFDGTGDLIKISNGNIGMYGASALGNSQYQALSNIPHSATNNPIKCLMPIVATNEHYNTTLFHNGVYRHSLTEGWITGQLNSGLEDTLIPYDFSLENNLHSPADYGYSNKVDLTEDMLNWFIANDLSGTPSGAHPSSILRYDLDASIANVDGNGFSDLNGVYSRYTNLDVPIYHLTGWWDIFINGQIETFNNTRNQNPTSNQKIVIGPWTHQTIGSQEVGDVIYPENVIDVLGLDLNFNLADFYTDPNFLNDIYASEMLNWYRTHLGGEPFFFIPESNLWQTIGTSQVRIPSENYIVPYSEFLNFIGGQGSLSNLPIEINTGALTIPINYDLPALDPPLFNLSQPVGSFNPDYFNQVKDIRAYVSGPTDDLTNSNVGNYWLEIDSFPFHNGILPEKIYLHYNQTANNIQPTENEGEITYTVDPNNPVITVGGNNMIPTVPGGGSKKSQGSMDLANPVYAPYTMNRPDVISFETEPLVDTLTVMGFPKAMIYAKGNGASYPTLKTDYDIMVRIVDVYPDGREMFITEGVVNAKAKDYAKSIFDKDTNDNILLTNVDNDTYYPFYFDLLPMAHTFGTGHQIKFLISSSNFPKYQSNPHLPNEANEFFRWKPGDTNGYSYEGNLLFAQNSEITLQFNESFSSYIELPKVEYFPNEIVEPLVKNDFKIYPNPTNGLVVIEKNFNEAATIEVISLSGKLVFITEFKTNENQKIIDFSSLAPGIYFVKILSPVDGVMMTKKIIVN